MANKTPTSNMIMYLPIGGGAEDNSLESAIRMTIASGIRPTRIQNWLSLVSNIPNLDLIHNSYGTRGSTPADFGQLNGYPKPTVSMNYLEITDGSYPSAQTDKAYCKPVLNNIVGFDVTITMTTEEWPDGDEETQVNYTYTFKFNKGSTTPDLVKRGATTIYAESGGAEDGYWKINVGNPSNGYYIDFYLQITADNDTYYGNISNDEETWDTLLNYTAAATVYDYPVDEYENLECSSTVLDTLTVYSLTAYGSVGNGTKLYTDSGLTTYLPSGNYSTDAGNYFYVNGSGTVSSFDDTCEI